MVKFESWYLKWVRNETKLLDLQVLSKILLLLQTHSSSKSTKLYQKLKVSSKIWIRGLGFELCTEKAREAEKIRDLKIISYLNRVQTLNFSVLEAAYVRCTYPFVRWAYVHGIYVLIRWVRGAYMAWYAPRMTLLGLITRTQWSKPNLIKFINLR